MSGAPKPRLVLCPKCRQLLPESPDYDVYKCGGCGTTLQAKKRRSGAVNSESSTRETNAAPRNVLDPASNDKQYSKEEQLTIPQENGLNVKASSSSSGECSLDGNSGKDQIENGKCNGEQLVLPQENGSREKATTSSGEYSLDGNSGRGEIENGECNRKQVVLPHQQNGLRKKATTSSGECSLDANGGRGQTENEEECNGEQLGPFNLSDEELENEMDSYKLSDIRRHRVSNKGCLDELTNSEIEASTELMVENSVESENDTNLQLAREELSSGQLPLEEPGEELIYSSDEEDANNEKSAVVGVKSEVDVTGSDLEGAEELNYGNLLPEGAEWELISRSDREDANNDRSALVGANRAVDITGSSKADAEESNDGNLLLEDAEEELNICALDGEDPKNDQSALVGAKTEVDITGSAFTTKRSSTENFVSENGGTSPCKLEDGTYGNHVSSPNEQLRRAQKNTHHSFDSVRSVDTFDATEVINPTSELSGTLEELSKSPTTRSFHAYDGSVSSNDGMDERFPSQPLDSFENTYTVANGVSEGRSRRGKGLVDSMLYGGPETQHESYLPNANHQGLKNRRGNQNQVPETTRHGHPHWMRTRRDDFPSKMPFHQNGSQSGYESGSPSNQTHDELYCSSSFLSPDTSEDPDQEKMKLLTIVYKLQEQLNRTSYANGETNGRLSTGVSHKGKHISPYHSHDLHEGRFYHGRDYPIPRCDGRCSHGINWHQMHAFSRPYLAETPTSTHHADQHCLHCCPQEWQCSAELPPRVFYQHEELCRSHLGHNRCSSHQSYPSSPQWFMASKLPVYSHEIKSGDQRHIVPEVKKYLREKHHLTKRHYRPVAGGAPFVTCHKCLRLLQLPADFLLFKRVCHQLKCGACSEVLKFSLQNRSHIVSYAPNALGPPSSDLDDQNEVINGSSLHSPSHAKHHHSSSHADPLSYSDDYGHSVSKSYSSEGDPVSQTPFHPMHGSEHDNPSVSRGTNELPTEEKIASRGPSTSEATVETNELAVHSSSISGSEKLPSEMEARSPPKSSPLHQLMGYSSPIQVIKGIKSSVEGKEPILKGEIDLSSQQN